MITRTWKKVKKKTVIGNPQTIWHERETWANEMKEPFELFAPSLLRLHGGGLSSISLHLPKSVRSRPSGLFFFISSPCCFTPSPLSNFWAWDQEKRGRAWATRLTKSGFEAEMPTNKSRAGNEGGEAIFDRLTCPPPMNKCRWNITRSNFIFFFSLLTIPPFLPPSPPLPSSSIWGPGTWAQRCSQWRVGSGSSRWSR